MPPVKTVLTVAVVAILALAFAARVPMLSKLISGQ